MRMGPGKHLKGRILMDGLVKPEEFDYFHEVSLLKLFTQSVIYTFTSAHNNSRVVAG